MEQPELFTTSLRSMSSQSGCMHLFEKTNLDNSNIVCSSWKAALRLERPKPDFGLYADFVWRPRSRNEFIDWPDFNAPKYPRLAYSQICSAYSLGKSVCVEIGCIGGHGRTGTILACMSILDKGFNPDDAINFTRDTYCSQAIETSSQERFVELFWEMHYEL